MKLWLCSAACAMCARVSVPSRAAPGLSQECAQRLQHARHVVTAHQHSFQARLGHMFFWGLPS